MGNNIEIFKNYYKKEKENLNRMISDYNKKLINEENEMLKSNLEVFSKLNSNGKLLRGMLINFGYKLTNPKDDNYSNYLALAYEIFQTSILVHDDIIDDDNLRRGNKTIHYVNYEKYSNVDSSSDFNHLSKSVAICMGDYGLYLSNSIISKYYKDDKNLGNILVYFNDIVLKTIKGELIDTILPIESKYNLLKNDLEDDIFLIYKLKTAYYTVVGPLCLGIILGSKNELLIDNITKFGEKIGIAYQIQDDILGIYEDNMGKVIGSDIKEFKQTILYSYIIKYKNEYKDELLKYYGKKLNKNSIEKVRNIFDKSGAKKYAIDTMNKLYDEGLKILDNIEFNNNEDKKILYGFVEYLRKRNK